MLMRGRSLCLCLPVFHGFLFLPRVNLLGLLCGENCICFNLTLFFYFTAGWVSNPVIISSTGWLPAAGCTTSTIHTQREPHVTDQPTDGADDAGKLHDPAGRAAEPTDGATDQPNESYGSSEPDVADEPHGANAASLTNVAH